MPTVTDELTAVRDAAHLNQHALDLVAAQAQDQFDSISAWPDSSAKQSALLHIGRTLTGYRNAQREALALRDDVSESLTALGADVPPLPVTTGDPQWSVQDW
jgi:hypothetical protein